MYCNIETMPRPRVSIPHLIRILDAQCSVSLLYTDNRQNTIYLNDAGSYNLYVKSSPIISSMSPSQVRSYIEEEAERPNFDCVYFAGKQATVVCDLKPSAESQPLLRQCVGHREGDVLINKPWRRWWLVAVYGYKVSSCPAHGDFCFVECNIQCKPK